MNTGPERRKLEFGGRRGAGWSGVGGGGGSEGKGKCLLMQGQCVMHVWNDVHVQAPRLSQQPSVEPGSIQGHVEVPLKRYFIGVSLIGVSLINKQIQRSGRRIA